MDAYNQDIVAFIRFVQRVKHRLELDGQLVLEYLDHLRRERNLKHATIRRRLVTLRAFANWLRKATHVADDPFVGLEIDLRPPRQLPRPVECVDVRTMLKAALGEGVHSADVILNILARAREPARTITIMTSDALRLRHEPAADCARYDNLRRAL